jgi:hypothetical protein
MRIWAVRMRRVLAHLSWRRAMELTTDSREEALGQGARSRLSSHAGFESPMGARHEATQDGRGLQPEERHDLAAEVHRIDHRHKTRYGGFSNEYIRTQYLLWNGDSISGFDQPLPESVPCYRHAMCLGLSQRHFAYRGGPLTT